MLFRCLPLSLLSISVFVLSTCPIMFVNITRFIKMFNGIDHRLICNNFDITDFS